MLDNPNVPKRLHFVNTLAMIFFRGGDLWLV